MLYLSVYSSHGDGLDFPTFAQRFLCRSELAPLKQLSLFTHSSRWGGHEFRKLLVREPFLPRETGFIRKGFPHHGNRKFNLSASHMHALLKPNVPMAEGGACYVHFSSSFVETVSTAMVWNAWRVDRWNHLDTTFPENFFDKPSAIHQRTIPEGKIFEKKVDLRLLARGTINCSFRDHVASAVVPYKILHGVSRWCTHARSPKFTLLKGWIRKSVKCELG